MTLKHRQFTREFKHQVLQQADSGKSISQLAREYQVDPATTAAAVVALVRALQCGTRSTYWLFPGLLTATVP